MLFSAQTPIESINANIQSAHPTANAQVRAVIGEKQVEETALFDLRLTITEDDYTCDSRGTPFFFWSSVDGDFSEATADFKSVVFQADSDGTNPEAVVTVGVGDGLGQVSKKILKIKRMNRQ
jgi:hypothetical protein